MKLIPAKYYSAHGVSFLVLGGPTTPLGQRGEREGSYFLCFPSCKEKIMKASLFSPPYYCYSTYCTSLWMIEKSNGKWLFGEKTSHLPKCAWNVANVFFKKKYFLRFSKFVLSTHCAPSSKQGLITCLAKIPCVPLSYLNLEGKK